MHVVVDKLQCFCYVVSSGKWCGQIEPLSPIFIYLFPQNLSDYLWAEKLAEPMASSMSSAAGVLVNARNQKRLVMALIIGWT